MCRFSITSINSNVSLQGSLPMPDWTSQDSNSLWGQIFVNVSILYILRLRVNSNSSASITVFYIILTYYDMNDIGQKIYLAT